MVEISFNFNSIIIRDGFFYYDRVGDMGYWSLSEMLKSWETMVYHSGRVTQFMATSDPFTRNRMFVKFEGKLDTIPLMLCVFAGSL